MDDDEVDEVGVDIGADRDASRRARISMLVRQREEAVALPAFRQRLEAAGAVVEGERWIRLPERDSWLERYETARRRFVDGGSPVVIRRSDMASDFARSVDALGEVVDQAVVAIPRSKEVGCVRVAPDRFAELALALLDIDGDDVSVVSARGDDGAHLVMYEESGRVQRELQVWGERWVEGLTG